MVSGVKISAMTHVPSGTLISGDLFEMERNGSPNNFTYSTSIDDISNYIVGESVSAYAQMSFFANSRYTYGTGSDYSTPVRIEAGPVSPTTPPNYSGYGLGLSSNFTMSNGVLTYTGLTSTIFQLNVSVGIFSSGSNTGNGFVNIAPQLNSSYLGIFYIYAIPGQLYDGSTSQLITLNTNDTIQILMSNSYHLLLAAQYLYVTLEPVISIGNTSASTTDLQDAYDNGNGTIVLSSGKPFELESTVAGFVMPSMSTAQFEGISSPDNGLMGWSNDDNRIIVNTGISIDPFYNEVAYLSDIPIVPPPPTVTLQAAYDNGTGTITLVSGKPFELESTVAGFVMPVMTYGQFTSITSPDNGLMAFDSESNRIVVNVGIPIDPFYYEVAYTSDIPPPASLQNAYDNSDGVIILVSGKPFELDSTVAGFVLPNMTQFEFISIATPSTGLMGWDTDNSRIIVNSGNPSTPFYQEVAWTSEIPIVTLQTAYDNDTGTINLTSYNGPFTLTTSSGGGFTGMIMPSLSSADFETISVQPNGLMAWANDINRIIVNKGDNTFPIYDEVAYISDVLSGGSTLQDAYNASLPATINLVAGNPFQLASTVAGFLMPSMTQSQFQSISLPDNGLIGWVNTATNSNDNNRFFVNRGTTSSPIYDRLIFKTDISANADIYILNNTRATKPGTPSTTAVRVEAGPATPTTPPDYSGYGLYVASQFSFSNGVLTYTGNTTKYFYITVSLFSYPSAAPVSINREFNIRQNSADIRKMQVAYLLGSKLNCTVSMVALLNPNDTLQVTVNAIVSDGEDITVIDMNWQVVACGYF
jgi:hypothetical protein